MSIYNKLNEVKEKTYKQPNNIKEQWMNKMKSLTRCRGGEALPSQRSSGSTIGSQPVTKRHTASRAMQVGPPKGPGPTLAQDAGPPARWSHSLVVIVETVCRLLVLSVHPALFAVRTAAHSASIKTLTDHPHQGLASHDYVASTHLVLPKTLPQAETASNLQ